MNTAIFISTLLFFQAAPKPLIDNARVTVWEGEPPAGSFVNDSVTVTTNGAVRYYKKDSLAVGAKLIISLKPAKVAALANTSGFPLAMPRPGAIKILDNDRVTAWDYTWALNKPTPMHFHDKDVVVMFLEEGDLKSTTAKGEVTLNQYKPGTIRFNARDRVHTEELTRGKQRAIIVELK
ncbi:MAG: hypothetical protein ABI811_01275 [Acidobacteriota bacterium]